jgi:PAS domain S-box-containing protein
VPGERREILGRWLRGQKVEDALERASREWRSTFDAIEWPIVVAGAGGLVVRLNRSAQQLGGMEFQEMVGRPLESIAPWEPWREMAAAARTVLETRQSQSRHVRGDRSKVWHVSASFVEGASREEELAVVVARDVTPVTQLETSLRRSEPMVAMGTLVSGVAHEVRNPLFAISATVDALEARLGAEGPHQAFMATLRTEIGRLSRLMRDLLDYGKPWTLDTCEVDASEVVAAGIGACQALAEQRQVAVHNRLAAGLARPRLDRARMAQVIQNLVENAVHHSPPGSAVEVQGALVRAASGRCLEIAVVDLGPGIPADDLPHVFEPFHSRRRGGTGLGLSIVKRIVEAHGGEVEAGNGPAGGAIFTLTLPLPGEAAASSGV